MRRSNYPSWLLKKHLNRVRNRYVHYIKSKNSKIEKDFKYSWADCYYKAKAKINYRFHNNTEDINDNNDWMNVMASIKARLIRTFDNSHAWRVTEYNILEKINKQDFNYMKSPSLIWNYVAVDKAGKANKIYKSKPYSRQRTKKYDWADVINNSKMRINNYMINDQSDEDKFWELCLSANFEKVRMRMRILDWNSCIYKNYKKILRLINNNKYSNWTDPLKLE